MGAIVVNDSENEGWVNENYKKVIEMKLMSS